MTLICILHTLVPVCYVCFPTPTINDLPWTVCLVCLRIDLSKTTRRSPKACFCFVLLFFARGSFSSSSTLSSVQSISCHLSRTEINQQHINIHYPIPSCVSKRRRGQDLPDKADGIFCYHSFKSLSQEVENYVDGVPQSVV